MTPADAILERAISDCALHLSAVRVYEDRREVAELMRRLIAMRSPGRVGEMERKRGLAHG